MGCIDPPDLSTNNLQLQPHPDVLAINETVEYICKPGHWLESNRSLTSIELRCDKDNEFIPVTDIGFCVSGNYEPVPSNIISIYY